MTTYSGLVVVTNQKKYPAFLQKTKIVVFCNYNCKISKEVILLLENLSEDFAIFCRRQSEFFRCGFVCRQWVSWIAQDLNASLDILKPMVFFRIITRIPRIVEQKIRIVRISLIWLWIVVQLGTMKHDVAQSSELAPHFESTLSTKTRQVATRSHSLGSINGDTRYIFQQSNE